MAVMVKSGGDTVTEMAAVNTSWSTQPKTGSTVSQALMLSVQIG